MGSGAARPGGGVLANVIPTLEAVGRCVLLVAQAFTFNAKAVATAAVRAVHQLAIVAVEPLMAKACAISADAVVGAVVLAVFERAVQARVAIVAQACVVGLAVSMPGAMVGTLTIGAVGAAEARRATANPTVTEAAALAIVRAANEGAVGSGPTREAVAGAVVAVAIVGAVIFAGQQGAVKAGVPFVADAGVVFAHPVQRALVRAARGCAVLTLVTGGAHAATIVAVTVAAAILGASAEGAGRPTPPIVADAAALLVLALAAAKCTACGAPRDRAVGRGPTWLAVADADIASPVAAAVIGAKWCNRAELTLEAFEHVGLVAVSKMCGAIAHAVLGRNAFAVLANGTDGALAARAIPALLASANARRGVAGPVARAGVGADALGAVVALPTLAALAGVWCDALAVVAAVCVTHRAGAVNVGPASLAFADVGCDAGAVVAAASCLSGADGGETVVPGPPLGAAAKIWRDANTVGRAVLVALGDLAGVALPAVEALAVVGVLGGEVGNLEGGGILGGRVAKSSIESSRANVDRDTAANLEPTRGNLGVGSVGDLEEGQRGAGDLWIIGQHLGDIAGGLLLKGIHVLVALFTKVNRRVLIGRVARVVGHAYSVSGAVVGANAVGARRSLPAFVAHAHTLRNAFAISMALVVAVWLRAIVPEPALVALAGHCADAVAVARAHLAGQHGLRASVADGDVALRSLPALPATANAVHAVTLVGAVSRAVGGLAVCARVALVAVAGEGCNAQPVSGAVVGAGGLIAVLALVPGCAVRAVITRKVACAVADSGRLHANAMEACAVVRAQCTRAVQAREALVADARAIGVAFAAVGAVAWAALEGAVDTVRHGIALAASGVEAGSCLRAVVRAHRCLAEASSPAKVAFACSLGAISVVVAIVLAGRLLGIAELAGDAMDDGSLVGARAHALVWNLAATAGLEAGLGASHLITNRPAEPGEAVAGGIFVIASSMLRAVVLALVEFAFGTMPLGFALALARTNASSVAGAVTSANWDAAVGSGPGGVALARSVDALALVVALGVVEDQASETVASGAVVLGVALADAREDAFSIVVAVGGAVGNIAGAALPSAVAAAEAVRFAKTTPVAILLADANGAARTAPALLALTFALHAFSVVVAVVCAGWREDLGGLLASKPGPALLALAQAWMQALATIGAVVETHGLVAGVSDPASKALAEVAVLVVHAFAVHACAANDSGTVDASKALVAGTDSGLEAFALVAAVLGADGGFAVVACPA